MNTLRSRVSFFIILFLCFGSLKIHAQSYTCTVQNQRVLNTDFLFDIYLQCTSSTNRLFLGNSDLSISFSSSNFINPGVVLDTLGAPGSKLETWYSADAIIPSGYPDIIKLSLVPPSVGTQTQFNSRVQDFGVNQTGPGTYIATIRVTGINNSTGTMNLQWRTSSPHATIVSRMDSTSPWNQNNITSSGVFSNPSNAPLPVEMVLFTASVHNREVNLFWKTVSELNSLRFDVERIGEAEHEWNTIGSVNASGSTDYEHNYRFVDTPPSWKAVWYRLRQWDRDGRNVLSAVLRVRLAGSNGFALYPPYPNPGLGRSTLVLSLPEERIVTIRLYDLRGREVQRVYSSWFPAGVHSVNIHSLDLPAGIYRVSVMAGSEIRTELVTLL